jgi:hypothetical protein
MINPADLHRYFKVRHIASSQEVWLEAGDVRYEVTGDGWGDYRPAPDGEYFLAFVSLDVYCCGWPMRLDEVEPLPDGRGLWAVPDELKLAMSYEGSWRQFADSA